MQTIASLANRLDMSPAEAVETLRKLRFDVEGVESEISDEQCDILMDVDEDPSELDRLIDDINKKEEQARKRTERLQKAARKAASKKKKPENDTIDSEISEVDSEAEIMQESTPEIITDLPSESAAVVSEDTTESSETAPEQAEPAPNDEKTAIEAEEPTPGSIETSLIDTSEAEVAEIIDDSLAVETKEEEPTQPLEVITDVEEVVDVVDETPVTEEISVVPDSEESIAETKEQVAEILPPVEDEGKSLHKDKSGPPEGTLARADQLQIDEDRRKRQQEAREKERRTKKDTSRDARPLPVPDPAVVAEVIRKAKEKEAAKLRVRENKPPRTPKPVAAGPEKSVAPRVAGKKQRDQRLEYTPLNPIQNMPLEELGKAGAGKGVKAGKKRKKRQDQSREADELLRRDAAAVVRGIQAGGIPGSPPKRRKKNQRTTETLEVEEIITGGVIEVDESMTVEQLAEMMEQEVNAVILDLMDLNIMANKNQSLELEVIRKIATKYNFEVQSLIPEVDEIFIEEPDNPEDLELRPPVITVMGHVDHGKTSFLDVIRKANVVDGEAGGITQHIAAYTVEMPQGKVAFLDTPGHEAFTHMRSRGAQITDIVVLVVAADDGVKPQTVEAIHHARAADVPVVVAVNKCDKPEAQPERVRQELTQYDLIDEAWGGKTIIKNISCHTREGIQELLEMLVLEAEMLELKANPNKPGRGIIIEAELTTGLGPVAWVLVQSGTLRVGDVFLSGETYGRVRTLTNSRGEIVQEAGPSTPVVVTGFSATPEAGELFITLADERMARNVAEKREFVNRNKRGASSKHMTLEDFHARMMGLEQKELGIIIKADVQGSVDVLASSVTRFGNEEVSVNVVHAGVGAINESDVLLASASDAVIIGFHVTANPKAVALAEREGVEIRTYLVIYEALDDIRKALEGMLAPDKKEVVTGRAEVRAVFSSSSLGNIAGCYQMEGETERGSLARLIRDGETIHESRIATVRREKDDVRSVSTGYECGLRIDRFDKFKEGDIIECFRIESVPKTLA